MTPAFHHTVRITLLFGALALCVQLCFPVFAHGLALPIQAEQCAPAAVDFTGFDGLDTDEELDPLLAQTIHLLATAGSISARAMRVVDGDRSGLGLLTVAGLQPSAP